MHEIFIVVFSNYRIIYLYYKCDPTFAYSYIIHYVPYAVLYIPMTVFVTGNLYILIPSLFLPILSTPLPSGNNQFVLCIYELASVLSVHTFVF